MTIQEYAKVVADMRQKQKRYFSSRRVSTLWEATAAEQKVDSLTREVLEKGEEAGNQKVLPLYGEVDYK